MILHGGISRKGMEETGEGDDCLCDAMSIRVCVHHVSCLKSGEAIQSSSYHGFLGRLSFIVV